MTNSLNLSQIAYLYQGYIGARVDLSDTEWYQKEKETRNRFLEARLVSVRGGYPADTSSYYCVKHNIETQNKGFQWLSFEVGKLMLTPVDLISYEDARVVATMFQIDDVDKMYFFYTENAAFISRGNTNDNGNVCPTGDQVGFYNNKATFDNGQSWDDAYEKTNDYAVNQYLKQRGYAIAEFVAPGHPDNGKSLIDMGLAIDATAYQFQVDLEK